MALLFIIAVFAGILHHFVVQYPKQAALWDTFVLFAASNAIFLLFNLRFMFDMLRLPGFYWLLISDSFFFSVYYIFTALLLKTIYNVYFRHRGIPGKFSFTATDWTLWRHVQWGNPLEKIASLHRELGLIVRIQPNHISFNDIQAFQEIYGQSTKARKDDFYAIGSKPGSLISETENSRHSFLRRVLNPSFSPAALKSFDPLMKKSMDRFVHTVQKVADQRNGVVEMSQLFHNLSLDVVGSFTLGVDIGAIEDAKEHYFVTRVHQAFGILNMFSTIPWLSPLLKHLPMREKMTGRRGVLKGETVVRALEKETVPESHHIIEKILNAKDPKTGIQLNVKDLAINSQSLLGAGSNGTAIGLTFALYLIVADEKYWKRLCGEIRGKFNSPEGITGQSTETMLFLNAVIYEALRLHPPVTAIQPRITPPEGMMLAGRFIAGNTVVSCPNWAMLHCATYFSNPMKFIPERWIDEERGSETCARGAWIPFLYGKWNCIGKPLAIVEMRVALARLIWHFDIKLREGQEAPMFRHLPVSVTPMEVFIEVVRMSDFV